jgi:hypothetical protein
MDWPVEVWKMKVGGRERIDSKLEGEDLNEMLAEGRKRNSECPRFKDTSDCLNPFSSGCPCLVTHLAQAAGRDQESAEHFST